MGVVAMLVRLRCVLNMGQTTWNTSAGIAAQWQFSSASAQLIFAMLVTTISRGWRLFPNLSCLNVLLVLRLYLFIWSIRQREKNSLLDAESAERLTPSRARDKYL